MIKNINLKKINTDVFLEDIFLLLMAFLIAYYFLCNTMFEIDWPSGFLLYLRSVMMVVVFFRLATSKNNDMTTILFMVLIAFVFYASYINDTSDTKLVYIVILILGAHNIRIEKIAITYFFTTFVLLSVTIFNALTGHIANSVYSQSEGSRIRYALGTTHYFWVTAYIFYLICAYLIIRQTKIKYIELIVIELINIIFYIFCRARNYLICISLIVILISIFKMRHKADKISSLDSFLGCAVPLLSSFFSIIVIIFYKNDSKIFLLLNKLFSGRLSLGKIGYDALGFSILGKKVITYGWSKNGMQYNTQTNGFVIDSGYFYMAIKYGIIVLCVFLLILLWMNYKACKTGNKILLVVLCVNAIQFIIDRDMFYVNCDFLIWCVFASFQYVDKRKHNTDIGDDYHALQK